MKTLRSGATVTSLPLDEIDPGFERAEVRFDGLLPPDGSFELRVFAGEPHADASTPTEGNPHYLGSQYFYGVGAPDQPGEERTGQQFAPTQIRLNVTDGVRALLREIRHGEVPLTLVAVDRDGAEIPEPGLRFEGLSVVTS
jgi:hypothetical protein